MIYFIERFNAADLAFQGSVKAVNINNKIYDIVEANKNSDLESISEVIISLDTKTFEKIDARIQTQVEDVLEREFGLQMNTLLLG